MTEPLAVESSGVANNAAQPNTPATPETAHAPPSTTSNALGKEVPGRRRRIQWNNFKGPVTTLTTHLVHYQGLKTGKAEWASTLADQLVCDDTFMAPLKEKGHTVGDVRKSIPTWFHNKKTLPGGTKPKKAVPPGNNPLWAAFTRRKVSPTRIYMKTNMAAILKETGGRKDIGLVSTVAARQFSKLTVEERERLALEAEEASKPQPGQCWINQLHAMPVMGDALTELIGPGSKQLGNCAFYVRGVFVDERGVIFEEEMCVSKNPALAPYIAPPDNESWKAWRHKAVEPNDEPTPDDEDKALGHNLEEEAHEYAPPSGRSTSPEHLEQSRPDSSACTQNAPPAPVASSANKDSEYTTSAPTLPDNAQMTKTINRASSMTLSAGPCPATPSSARVASGQNMPELPRLNHVPSVEWVREQLESHFVAQWRLAGWTSPLNWIIVEGDRERYLMSASSWQRHATICPARLELIPAVTLYGDLETAWNVHKVTFFKDASHATAPTPRKRVVSITARTPRTPQTPSRLSRPQVGDIQLPAPLTLARTTSATLSRRSSSSTLPSTPQRHSQLSRVFLDSDDFVPLQSPTSGHIYVEKAGTAEPWEVLASLTNKLEASRQPSLDPSNGPILGSQAANANDIDTSIEQNVDGKGTRMDNTIPGPDPIMDGEGARAPDTNRALQTNVDSQDAHTPDTYRAPEPNVDGDEPRADNTNPSPGPIVDGEGTCARDTAADPCSCPTFDGQDARAPNTDCAHEPSVEEDGVHATDVDAAPSPTVTVNCHDARAPHSERSPDSSVEGEGTGGRDSNPSTSLSIHSRAARAQYTNPAPSPNMESEGARPRDVTADPAPKSNVDSQDTRAHDTDSAPEPNVESEGMCARGEEVLPDGVPDTARMGQPVGPGRGRGRGRGGGRPTAAVGSPPGTRPTTRSQARPAEYGDATADLTPQETNTATENMAGQSSRRPGSFKLKLTGTTILAVNGAPPQHRAGSSSSQSAKKRKREDNEPEDSRKRARTGDENRDPQQQEVNGKNRPQRKRLPATPRGAVPVPTKSR